MLFRHLRERRIRRSFFGLRHVLINRSFQLAGSMFGVEGMSLQAETPLFAWKASTFLVETPLCGIERPLFEPEHGSREGGLGTSVTATTLLGALPRSMQQRRTGLGRDR